MGLAKLSRASFVSSFCPKRKKRVCRGNITVYVELFLQPASLHVVTKGSLGFDI